MNELKPSNNNICRSNEKRNWKFITIAFIACIFFSSISYIRFGYNLLLIMYAIIMIIFSIISIVISSYYMLIAFMAQKKCNKIDATILDIVENHGFPISFSQAGATSATTSENGIGGLWQIFFLLWYELRFDCYFPVLSYEINGAQMLSTTSCGWSKNTWHIGEKISITKLGQSNNLIVPHNKKYLYKKSFHYMFLGLIILLISLFILQGGLLYV